ncbi:glutathione S-transferase 1-1-like [Contarinia nasturtii]|uniref:glutathione S-transferase 1-1-like n=1 Tax=Contarinia nasturtii TaxID=265458 RepID=UPI0012D44E86|nr:glutathione S-transferase 1-1-like [Contarinia nasturtii]
MGDKLILYYKDMSPPVRAVKLLARFLGLDFELREVNLSKGEHLKESFLKLNPQHTIPTLLDGDFSIWDSHAICMYLVDKYAKDDALYPKDLKLRAKCNQRLFFDDDSLYTRLRDCSYTIYRGGKEISQEKIDRINSSYEILEAFLASDPFLVGNTLTIADICAASNVLPLQIFAPLETEKHRNILAWLSRVSKTIPFFDEMNVKIVKEYREMLMGLLEKNKQNAH